MTNLPGRSIEKRLAEIELLEVKGPWHTEWATNETRKRTKRFVLWSSTVSLGFFSPKCFMTHREEGEKKKKSICLHLPNAQRPTFPRVPSRCIMQVVSLLAMNNAWKYHWPGHNVGKPALGEVLNSRRRARAAFVFVGAAAAIISQRQLINGNSAQTREQRLITKQTPREPLMEGEVLVYRLLLERRKTLDARRAGTWRNLCVSRRAGLFTCRFWKCSACRANALLCQRERCTRNNEPTSR